MKTAPYYLIFLVAAIHFAALAAGGAWPLVVPLVVFGLVPVADVLVGRDEGDEGHTHDRWFDLPLFLWVPVQLAAIGWLVWAAPGLSWTTLLCGSFATGILGGAGGITIAHELTHRKSPVARAAAEVLMASVTYTWFCVEHVLGHHRNVATPRDPATSRFGESVYAFLPRTLLGGLTSFWAIERDYAGRRGIRPWDPRDRRLRYLAVLALLHGGVLAVVGPAGWLAFALQSLVAVLLLEVINYVEHYGLERRMGPSGEPERVRPHHSWNSTERLTGAFLFSLPRHADHHAFAARPYGDLRAWPGAPQLPWGYATAVMVALVPPLWRNVMDPRVVAARAAATGPEGALRA